MAEGESSETHTRVTSVSTVLNDASSRLSNERPVADRALGIEMVVGIVGNARSDSSGLGNGCLIEWSVEGEVSTTIGIVRVDRSVIVVASVA